MFIVTISRSIISVFKRKCNALATGLVNRGVVLFVGFSLLEALAPYPPDKDPFSRKIEICKHISAFLQKRPLLSSTKEPTCSEKDFM